MLKRWSRPLLLLILLAAFGVRVLGLSVNDLSDDEAFFVQIAHQGTYVHLAASDEPHPPLYLALLQGWMFPAGVTEYAVRFLSIAFGLATVAALYQLGRQLAGERLGLAAALAAALNPYQIFYSQTTRDYQIACCFGAISMVLFLWALRRPRFVPAYVLAALLAIVSHYYALAILLFEQLILMGWLWRHKLTGLRRWLAADVVIAAVFLPWAFYSLRTVANYEPGHGTLGIVGSTLLQTFRFYNFGTAFHPEDLLWPSVAVAALLALGLLGLTEASGWRGLGLAVGYQLAPIVFGLITLVHTTQFGARFLFLGSPGYLLVIGGAVVLLAERWLTAWMPLAALGSLAGFAIHNTVFTDEYTNKGYSQLAAFLSSHISARDQVVLDGISQALQYWYYAQLRDGIGQQVTILPLKADGGGADGSPVDLGQTQRAVDRIAGSGPGVWLIEDDSLRYDPHLDTQRMLAQQAFRSLSVPFRGQRLDYYVTGSAGQLTGKPAEMDGIALVQASKLDRPVPAGQALPVQLEWRAQRANPAAFKESLRLVDSAGAVASQNDAPPGAGFWDAAWQAGATRDDRTGLMVPVGLPPGAYKLQLVAYDAASGRALGSPVELQDVQVDHSAPQRVSAAGLPPANETVGGERLVGIKAAPQVAAGEKLTLTLLWSGQQVAPPSSVPLSFGSVTISHQIGGSAYPTSRWQTPDVVRDDVVFRIPAAMAPGEYPIMAGNTKLASVRVMPTTRQFNAPPLSHMLGARFADVAQLLGYDVQPDPNGLHLRLVWKALTETPISYTVFVHALDDNGRIQAQVDQAPGTDNWDTGQYVTTTYTLAAACDCSLEVGLYNPKTGARLPVCSGTSECADPADHVVLPKA
ncbi:MAG TPA: glycosyltransferase family 39 protein [Chloroflexota bacterium]|nr:glycosyltransferase family 39 protein [Chloroflexota bacterium]